MNVGVLIRVTLYNGAMIRIEKHRHVAPVGILYYKSTQYFGTYYNRKRFYIITNDI